MVPFVEDIEMSQDIWIGTNLFPLKNSETKLK